MQNLTLKPSPRLWVTASSASTLRDRLHSPFLQSLRRKVLADADRLTHLAPLAEGVSPSYLQAGRIIQSRLECLTGAWILTRKSKYRTAAIKHLAGLGKFKHISCEARVDTPDDVELPFCLTYGEQSIAIGLMYDHFRADLTSAEQKVFYQVIDRFHLKQAIKCLTSPPWWANKPWSNWNGVCAGGMGAMALAFYDDRPDARPLVPFVEGSLGEYFKSYIDNGGGCHEGTGYWNYGMNYAMRYVLSWENATGQSHPALDIPQIALSLNFPVDFTGISFGDNDGWGPTGFYFLLAQRLGQQHAALRAAAYLPDEAKRLTNSKDARSATADLLYAADAIPTDAQMQKLKAAHQKKKVPVARIYTGMDWAILADDEAFPSLRMAIRGGSAKVAGHGMIDLLSFRCRVNGQLMITDQEDTGYLTTTFGKRGSEIYPRSAQAKSTLFVEGLGCAADATCKETHIVQAKGLSGIRIDATGIYLQRMPASFIGRLFIFVDNTYWLIVDHVLGNSPSALLGIESRFHTYCDYQLGRNHAALDSGTQKMQMTFAALQPGVIQESRGMPPLPKGAQTNILRWMGKDRVVDNLHVVALNPGRQKLGLTLAAKPKGLYEILVTQPGKTRRTIRLRSDLQLA